MSDSIFEVPLPNGTIVEVENAPNADVARARARLYFQQADPQGYAAWAAQQPAGGFVERAARGIDEFQGRLYRAAEAAGAATGIESLEQFGRRGAQRNVVEAEAAMPAARMRSFGEAEGVGGILRAGQQAIAGTLPEAPGPLAGALLGGAVGGIPGAMLGAAVGAFPSLVGGNVEAQRQEAARQAGGVEPERIPSPGTAIAAAVPQALVGGALDVLALRLARIIGVSAEEVGRTLLPRIARGIGAGAVTEVPEEVIQTAIQRAQAGQSLLDNDAMSDYYEAALGGAFAGGAFGGTVAGVAGRRPQAAQPPADQQPPEAEAAPPEPPPGPVLPDAPLPVESADQANEIIAARGLRLPEGIDDTGRIAAANIALNNEYRAEVDRIRNNELDTFLGRSQLQPAAEGAPQDLAPAADALTRNVLTAIGEGRLSEPRFTSRQITDLALENLGDAGPVPVRTRTQVKKYLDALQEAGYLQSAGKIGKDVAYTLPLRQAEAVAATAAPAPVVSEAPVAPPVVNVEPEVPAAPPVAQAITLTDLATNPQSASQFLNRAFAQNPGAINSVQSLQAAARNEGLVLPPDLATGLFAQAKQSGILSPTNLYVPPAKRAQRQQAPAAAAATQALNQIAQTGTPATISPQAAQQTAAAQQASEDLQQAVRATPAPTLPRQLQALPGSVPAGTIIEVNYGGQQYTLRGTGARPTVAPTQEPLAQWQIDNMNAARDLLQRAPALGQRIRELHNQGMVARDIASTLNLDVSDVRAMRDALGLRPLGPTVTPGGAVIPEEGGQPTQPPPSLAGVQTRGAPARTEAEQAEARQAFERVVGPRGRLTFEQTLFLQDLGAEVQAAAQAAGITGPIAGYASGDLAVLSLADSTMPLNQVAIHEGWHVAENIGIIKANDIAILNASRGTILNRIRNDLDFVADPDSLSNDEVRAYGANARVSRGTDFGGTVNAIYDRLANFVDRLRNFVAGRGFNSWRDVYDNFLSGRTASLSMPGESTTYGSTVNFASPDQKLAIISAEANLQYEQGLITAAERDAKIAAAGGLRYEVIDGRTGAVVGTYSNLARARNEADKRDAQYGAVRHRVKKISVATQKPINFAAPRPVSTPQQMQQATQQYFENQIRGPAKWFSSLDLSIAKDRPALRPAADNMQTFRLSRNEANADLEPRLEKLARLSPESSRKVMRVWQTASMTETAPNVSTLNAEERAALTDAMAGIQRAFDWLIEGYVSDYYTPNAKMPAAEQARLNAFWQRNSGKHLWEIPARELQAASPKGYQEYQRLNRMRNPYKLPAVADGSHFVAVYKRNAAGQREGKPVAMIAYTPRGRWQKLMRVPDPEVIARNELQRLYPNTTTHIVMQRGQQFTQGAEAGGIRSVGDAVTQFLSGLTSLPQFANSAGARNKLQSLLDTLNKQQIERVFRRSDDVLLAVNDLTDTSYGLDALPRYLLGISNIQARRRTQNDWAEAIKPLTPDDKKYLNDLRDYASTPTESFAGIRSLTFFSLLGFAPDSMAINMLQTVQATMPMLLRDGGVGALRHFGRAYKELTQATGQATKSLLSSNRQNPVDIMTNILRDPQELADYKKALNVGTLLPLYLNESRGQVSVAAMRRLGFRNPEQRAKNFNNVLRLSGGMQAFAEQTNRAVSFLAAYRAAKADPQIIANKNRTDNLQLQTPYDYATSIVNDTHFVTDKSDRALYQRFTPAAEVVTQFMSFVTKTIELYVRQAKLLYRGIAQSDMHLARAGAVGFIGMVAPIVALAGIWALPGAEFLKEALEALVGAVWGTTQNFDADMRRAVGGGFIGEAFSAGLPSTVGLASLSKRLALDPVPFNDIKSMEVFSLMGPSGSFIEKIGQFYNYMAQGDIANALVAFPLMPRAAGNIIKGVDIGLGSETIRSQRGNVLISPEQIAEIDSQNLVPVSVRQAIGLPSPAVMSLREALVRREELAKQNSVATTRFNNTAAGYYTDALRAQREGDNDRAARAFQRLQQHIRSQVEANAEAANAGRLDAIININMTAIRRRAYEDLMGRTSPQLGLRGVPQNIRPRAQEELQLYNWRGIGAPSN